MSGALKAEDAAVKKMQTVPLCVVLSRREANSPWADYIWNPVSVILAPPAPIHGKICEKGDGWTHFLMDCPPLELYRKDAEAYRQGLLQNTAPSLWVILQEDERPDAALPYSVQLVTASPFEAQDYLDSGELIIEAVDMPETLQAFISHFIDQCPEDEKFIKRKQKKNYSSEHRFGQQPLHEIRMLEKNKASDQ